MCWAGSYAAAWCSPVRRLYQHPNWNISGMMGAFLPGLDLPGDVFRKFIRLSFEYRLSEPRGGELPAHNPGGIATKT